MARGKEISQEKIGTKILGTLGGIQYCWFFAADEARAIELAKDIGLTNVRPFPIYRDLSTPGEP